MNAYGVIGTLICLALCACEPAKESTILDESVDLAAQQPEMVALLRGLYDEWRSIGDIACRRPITKLSVGTKFATLR